MGEVVASRVERKEGVEDLLLTFVVQLLEEVLATAGPVGYRT